MIRWLIYTWRDGAVTATAEAGGLDLVIQPNGDGYVAFATRQARYEHARVIVSYGSLTEALCASARYAAVHAFVALLARLGEGIETRDRCDTCGRASCDSLHPGYSLLTGDVLPATEAAP